MKRPSRKERKSTSAAANTAAAPGRLRRWSRAVFPSFEEIRTHRIEALACLAAGLLMILPYPRFNFWPVAWFGLAPMLWALPRARNAKLAVWLGFAFAYPFYYGNISWLNTLIIFHWAAPIGIALLALYLTLFTIPFSLTAAALLRRRPYLALILLPALWCALEFIRDWGQLAFPWIYLGHSQWNNILILQIAEYTGVFGISFLILAYNILLAELARLCLERKRSAIVIVAYTAFSLIILGIIHFGAACLIPRSKLIETGQNHDDARLRIALCQPNIDQVTKLQSYSYFGAKTEEEAEQNYEAANMRINSTMQKLTMQAAGQNPERLDLIVWPESAMTDMYFNLRPQDQATLAEWAQDAGAPIFMGASFCQRVPGKSLDEARFYNSAYLIEPGKGPVDDVYHKMQLVPFGEHLPYFNKIPFLRTFTGIEDFMAGDEYTQFKLHGGAHQQKECQFGALICFESSISRLTRGMVRAGAEFLVIVTNDAWYGLSKGPEHHMIHSVFRAVESRRWIVRCANTGVSCVIAPDGRVQQRFEVGAQGVLCANIEPRKDADGAFYTRHGDLFAWFCFLLGIAAIILGRKKRSNESK
ncbi:apolipoprotein N-acyltransferase [Candidatus Sumerlaeota bacterium]|nr:apolipoprotein N-acyltransferase [Candidatus Sumerlaeota bacterium]